MIGPHFLQPYWWGLVNHGAAFGVIGMRLPSLGSYTFDIFGAFHVSEVVAAGKHDTSRMALQMSQWAKTGYNCRWRCKTDQLGKGAFTSLGTCFILEICPFRALEDYLKKRGEDQGYLFCHGDGTPLTKYWFWKLLWNKWVCLDGACRDHSWYEYSAVYLHVPMKAVRRWSQGN